MIAINPGTPIQVLEEIADYIAGVLVLHVNPGFAGQKIVPHTIEKAARIRKYLDDLGHPEVYIESDGIIQEWFGHFCSRYKQYFPGGRY